MATKKAVVTRELRHHELPAWLTEKLSGKSIQAQADELGIARQTLSGVMCGRREPAKRLLAKFRKLGLVEVQKVYVVRVESASKK